MTTNPETKAATAPAKYLTITTDSIASKLRKSKTAAPNMAGILNKKEKRAACSLFILQNNEVAIVVPERDIPGIIAMACPIPIRIDFMIPILLSSNSPLGILSEKKMITPVTDKAIATTSGI